VRIAHNCSHILQNVVLSDKVGWEYAHLVAELSRPPTLIARYLGVSGQHLNNVTPLETQLVLALRIVVVYGRPQRQVGGRLVLMLGGVLVLVVRGRGGGVRVCGVRPVELCGPGRRVGIAQVGTSETWA